MLDRYPKLSMIQNDLDLDLSRWLWSWMVKTISETGSPHLFQLYSRYYTCIYCKKQKSWIFIMADGGHIGFGLYRNSWPPDRQAPRWFFMSRDPLTKWKWETPLSLFCKRVHRRGTGSDMDKLILKIRIFLKSKMAAILAAGQMETYIFWFVILCSFQKYIVFLISKKSQRTFVSEHSEPD